MVEVQDRAAMKPQCYMAMLYLNWAVYLGVVAWAGLTGRYFFSFAWAALYPAFMLAYLMVFPRISRLLGYGSVEDELAAGGAGGSGEEMGVEAAERESVEVTLYKAAGCPFAGASCIRSTSPSGPERSQPRRSRRFR
jgi:hypothetical protein